MRWKLLLSMTFITQIHLSDAQTVIYQDLKGKGKSLSILWAVIKKKKRKEKKEHSLREKVRPNTEKDSRLKAEYFCFFSSEQGT